VGLDAEALGRVVDDPQVDHHVPATNLVTCRLDIYDPSIVTHPLPRDAPMLLLSGCATLMQNLGSTHEPPHESCAHDKMQPQAVHKNN
jgi:hypothetical protein